MTCDGVPVARASSSRNEVCYKACHIHCVLAYCAIPFHGTIRFAFGRGVRVGRRVCTLESCSPQHAPLMPFTRSLTRACVSSCDCLKLPPHTLFAPTFTELSSCPRPCDLLETRHSDCLVHSNLQQVSSIRGLATLAPPGVAVMLQQ
jgi:hypothetical protein